MLNKLLKDYNIVLGSNSPRRKQYLTDLGFTFTVRASDIDESYPEELVREQITDYIAKAKADAIEILHDNEIIITSDTTVWNDHTSLGKPESRDEAYTMLKSLCGHEHEVISSVCLKSKESVSVFHCITKVSFSDLSDEALYFYIDQYKPYDKAGAYGIQEWIGLVGIDKIDGSYTNIVGLPTKELVEELLKFIKN